ncbi:MAG TPA: hypothetical protein VMU78_03610 [Methylocella sp.]|nr:hypothetical protein [Methylocella sp.]
MKNPYLKLIKKLDHPPAGPNWVRFVHDDPVKSAKAINSWVFGKPQFTYQFGCMAIKDRIELHIDLDTAIRIATSRGAPIGKAPNKSLVEAFFNYDAERKYKCQNKIGFEKEYFRVGRSVIVPVAPLSIIRENNKFVPIFICGWSTLALTHFQRRLLMTIYEDAFLSLTDFQDSTAEILFFPKMELDHGQHRNAQIWSRGDYELLSQRSLTEAVENFLLARDIVLRQLSEMADDWKTPKDKDSDEPGGQGDLF